MVDRLPALLSDAVENPRPHEPAFTRSAREVAQGRGAETQSNPSLRNQMTNRSKPDVEVFAGIDVSAREISVARLRGKEENPKFATFANSPSGHKALLAFLLQGTV